MFLTESKRSYFLGHIESNGPSQKGRIFGTRLIPLSIPLLLLQLYQLLAWVIPHTKNSENVETHLRCSNKQNQPHTRLDLHPSEGNLIKLSLPCFLLQLYHLPRIRRTSKRIYANLISKTNLTRAWGSTPMWEQGTFFSFFLSFFCSRRGPWKLKSDNLRVAPMPLSRPRDA